MLNLGPLITTVRTGFWTGPSVCGVQSSLFVPLEPFSPEAGPSRTRSSQKRAPQPHTVDPHQVLAKGGPTRAEAGFEKEDLVFGCFNQLYKVEPKVCHIYFPSLSSNHCEEGQPPALGDCTPPPSPATTVCDVGAPLSRSLPLSLSLSLPPPAQGERNRVEERRWVSK